MLWGVAPAAADTGVSIDVARIAVSQKLSPGGEYRLPAFAIRNPGNERTTYGLGVSYVEGQAGKQPPAGWFHFTPSSVTLDGGETRPVATRLDLPAGADPGDYAALVGAEIVREQEGARVGARAAARLTFVVEPSGGLEAWLRRARRFLSEHAPWSWLVPALIASWLAAWQLRRRFTVRVARRM
jgi:hypothetical protein